MEHKKNILKTLTIKTKTKYQCELSTSSDLNTYIVVLVVALKRGHDEWNFIMSTF